MTTTHTHASLEGDRSSAEIQNDIRETRGRMDATLDELGERLTARSLINSALDWWDAPGSGNQGSAALRSGVKIVARQAKKHPMPAVLIGSGIAWLVSETMAEGSHNGGSDEESLRRERTPGAGTDEEPIVATDSDTSLGISEKIRDKAASIGSTIHRAADRTKETGKSAAGHVAEEVRHSYHAGSEKFSRACDEYPLAVGVGFAALGALAGLIIPSTRKEDEMLGEQSDEFFDEAKDKAGRVMDTIREEAQEQGIGQQVSQAISGITEAGTHVVEKVKEEVCSGSDGMDQSSRSPDHPG